MKQDLSLIKLSLPIILIVFAYEPLVSINAGFSLIDELFFIITLFYALITYSMDRKNITFYFEEKVIICLLLSLFILGLCGNILYNYQSLKAAYSDAIVFFKAFITYFSGRIIFSRIENHETSAVKLQKTIIVAVFSIFVFLLLQFTSPIFENSDLRFGIPAQKLFFGHPSRFAFAAMFCFIILLPQFNKRNRLFLIMVLATGLFSLRLKYFVFALIAVFLTSKIWEKITKKSVFNLKNVIIASTILLPIIAFIVYKRFFIFYSTEAYDNGFARAVLSYHSVVIANEHFPFGSGFGTFASFFSGLYYSPLYFKYKIFDIYGISPDNISFIADTYWPMIIGQFGYIGLAIFSIILLFLFKLLLQQYRQAVGDKYKIFCMSAILLLTALIIDSTSDAILSQNRAVISFYYLAFLVSFFQKSEKASNGLSADS